jgi:hypothetical protein
MAEVDRKLARSVLLRRSALPASNPHRQESRLSSETRSSPPRTEVGIELGRRRAYMTGSESLGTRMEESSRYRRRDSPGTGAGKEPLKLAPDIVVVKSGRLQEPIPGRFLQDGVRRPLHEVVPDGCRNQACLGSDRHRRPIRVPEPEGGGDIRGETDRPAILIVVGGTCL